MVVTEFALCRLKPDYEQSGFLGVGRLCQQIQDTWIRENQPHRLQDKPYSSLSAFFLQNTGLPHFLITAAWDSPERHAVWLQSVENMGVLTKLREYIADVPNGVVVFHMDPAGSEIELRGDLFAQEAPFSLCTLSVSSSQKESVQEKYRSIEAQARVSKPGSRVWAGWRIEKDDDFEELVIFWNQGVLDGQLDDLLSTPDAEYEFRQFQNFE
ncbi:hypothetical protein EDB80DRAFT_440249 [Ilyonectria destructans]|nr:hypothetical protein EDB80DRAFT_440249 [Ilyonectria destructans]